MGQAGLGLPDRDYYFNEDERSIELRDAYVAHIENMFELAGFDDPAGSARMLMDLETKLASHHWTTVQNRDAEATYNKFATADLGSLADNVDWPRLLAVAGLESESDIIVNQPSYFEGFNEVFASTSLDDWKTYLRWTLLNNNAGYLSPNSTTRTSISTAARSTARRSSGRGGSEASIWSTAASARWSARST